MKNQTNSKFVEDIEMIRKSDHEFSYIDAISDWCSKNNVELEVAAYWIKKDPQLKAKIEKEATSLKMLTIKTLTK